jgi:hypothetical protein
MEPEIYTTLRLISNNEIVEPVEETDATATILKDLAHELFAIEKHAVKAGDMIHEILALCEA